jgi:small multidrug resistance pump
MASWLFLAAAIASEVGATVFMKLSESLTRWVYIPPMLALYLVSLFGLAAALRTIEVGIAYAVWAGVGTLFVSVIGIWFFAESTSWIKMVSIALVILGVIGLHLADARVAH